MRKSTKSSSECEFGGDRDRPGSGDRERIERGVRAVVDGRGHGPAPKGYRVRKVVVDHRRIPSGDLRIAKENARLDPDSQVFPWRSSLYPLVGTTVYYDGKLWTVYSRSAATALLTGRVHGEEEERIAPLGELRPVTWTQHDEDRLGLG